MGDMVTKERSATGKLVISSGKFYYDTRFKKVVYDIKFPKAELFVSKDTSLYYFEAGKFKYRLPSFATPETTVFHLSLTGRLAGFGLDEKNIYKIEKVTREGGKVYVTWKPDERIKNMGRVTLSQANNRLEGVVFFDAKGEVLAKQFFKNYTNMSGVEFPQEVIFISYKNKKEYYRVIKYHNVSINDFKDDKNYNYPLPVGAK
jgi:Domain of unknown function (DUF4292)